MASLKGKENPNYKTGYCMGKKPSFYIAWRNMKARCLNKNNGKYHRYGGRGITICNEWLSIEGFASWALKNGWQEGLTIDRIDNDGNYEPRNCQWISKSANSRKKSTTKIDIVTAQKIRERINENWYDLANEYNVEHGTIWFIMNNFTHVADNECTRKLKERKETKEIS